MPDKEAFERARFKVVNGTRQMLGIGTLSEKAVHAVLKNYYEPNEDYQEVPIDNYVADICVDGRITEIQTRQLGRLRDKLQTFLPEHQVTVVHPIILEKHLICTDKMTGQLAKKRKSPIKQTVYDAFPEFYQIKMFLKDPNLKLKLALINLEEYRLVNYGDWDRTRESSTFDQVPSALVDEVEINCLWDYMQFVPSDLKGPFNSRTFAKAAKISIELSQKVLNVLYHVDILTRVGKEGNLYLYEVLDI